MTYRGVYRDGIVVPSGETDFQDGDSVQIRRVSAKGVKKRTKSKATSKASAVHPFVALAGSWKDRPEWKGLTTQQIVQLLRSPLQTKPASRKRRRG